MHRQKFISLSSKGLYLALDFPRDDPPGWYWGTVMETTEKTGKDSFWVNFTPKEQEYDAQDDVKVIATELSMDKYKDTWALVSSQHCPPKDQ